MQVCYIYSHPIKGVVVLNSTENSTEKHKELIESGYKHNSTIDPAFFIQYLCSITHEELINEINKLKD